MESPEQTICSLLTPAGRGAIAVVAMMGPHSESALEKQFRPASGRRLSQIRTRQVVYGVWQSTSEDVVVVRRGTQHFEIQCHGGNVASESILRSLESANLHRVRPESFALKLNDRWTVESQVVLANASTERAAKIVVQQLEHLPAAIERLRALIVANQFQSAVQEIESMLKWSGFGRFLTHPRSVVLCGNPNVGKSSLVNAIVGYQRAIVHDAPGTTRDVVTQRTALDGWPVELTDTAGLRENTASPIEAIGVEKARAQIKSAQISVVVFDGSSPWTVTDENLITAIQPDLIVFNKSDLAPGSHQTAAKRPEGLHTSVTTGDGVPMLIKQLGTRLVRSLPDVDQPIPLCDAQIERLRETIEFILAARPDEAIIALGE